MSTDTRLRIAEETFCEIAVAFLEPACQSRLELIPGDKPSGDDGQVLTISKQDCRKAGDTVTLCFGEILLGSFDCGVIG